MTFTNEVHENITKKRALSSIETLFHVDIPLFHLRTNSKALPGSIPPNQGLPSYIQLMQPVVWICRKMFL